MKTRIINTANIKIFQLVTLHLVFSLSWATWLNGGNRKWHFDVKKLSATNL